MGARGLTVAAITLAWALAPGSAGGALAVSAQTAPPASPAPTAPEDSEARLVRVRRIFVESFGDDPISKQTEAMVVDALVKSKRFVVTENREKADAILKGSAVEKRSQELHAIGESGNVAQAVAVNNSSHSSQVNGRVSNGTGSISGSGSGESHGYAAAQSVGVDDSQATTETIDDARISVRLVDPDGDVIWSTTQESRGAKYKGASADAADKVAKQLLREVERLERKP